MKKTLKIRTRTVGQAFATCSQLIAGNGRVVWESRDYPYGFTAAAYAAAESEAARRGAEVAHV